MLEFLDALISIKNKRIVKLILIIYQPFWCTEKYIEDVSSEVRKIKVSVKPSYWNRILSNPIAEFVHCKCNHSQRSNLMGYSRVSANKIKAKKNLLSHNRTCANSLPETLYNESFDHIILFQPIKKEPVEMS